MLEVQVTELQRRLQETQKQVQERNALLAAANTKLQQMEQQTGRVHGEVEHWRKLARDTANKLWEIGQQIAEDRDVSQKIAGKLQDIQPAVRSAARVSVAPVGLSRERRFVRNSLLEAQESTSPSTRSASQSSSNLTYLEYLFPQTSNDCSRAPLLTRKNSSRPSSRLWLVCHHRLGFALFHPGLDKWEYALLIVSCGEALVDFLPVGFGAVLVICRVLVARHTICQLLSPAWRCPALFWVASPTTLSATCS